MRTFQFQIDGPQVLASEIGTTTARAAVQWPLEQLQALLDPAPGVAIAGRDSAVSMREEEAGRLIFEAMRGPVTERLERFLGGPGPRVILVDGGAELPWELLADGSGEGIEATGQAVVARLATGALPSEYVATHDLQVGLWALDEDAVSEEQADSLRSAGARAGGGGLLHLVCHGHRSAADRVELGADGLGTRSVTHAMEGAIRQAGLVCLDVCSGGSGRGDLVSAALATGCGACTGPRSAASLPALQTFNEELHDTLASGATVAEAVRLARAGIRALASPRPDARWHNIGLFVSHPDALSRQLVDPRWRPATWPIPSPPAGELLDAARAVADRGYFGIEHLALALGSRPSTLGDVPEVPALQVTGPLDESTVLALSPRLRSLALPTGFSVDDLLKVLLPAMLSWTQTTARVSHRDGTTLELTLREATASLSTAPLCSEVEILGGPEDGRRICLEPGETLGRAGRDGPTHALYDGTICWDPYLSRRHLTWLGQGHFELRRVGQHQRQGHPALDGVLRRGDRLRLTPATQLLAL